MRLLTTAALVAASLACLMLASAMPASAQGFPLTSPPAGDPFSWSRLSKVDHPDIPNCNLIMLLQDPNAVCEQLPLMPPTDAGSVYFSSGSTAAPASSLPPSGGGDEGDGGDGHHGHHGHHHHGDHGHSGHGHGHGGDDDHGHDHGHN